MALAPSTKKNGENKSQSSQTFSSNLLKYISDPTVQKGIAISAVALFSLLMYSRSSNKSTTRRSLATDDGTSQYNGPPPLSRETVEAMYSQAVQSLQRKSMEKPSEDSNLTPEFKSFYQQIMNSAPPDQHPDEVRLVIAEFLMLHGRFQSIAISTANKSPLPPKPLSMNQGDMIRSWVKLEIPFPPKTPGKLIALGKQIDLLYRVGLAQQSVPDLLVLRNYLRNSFPEMTDHDEMDTDNFFAIFVQTRFLLACIFGDWEDARRYSVPLDKIMMPRGMKVRMSYQQRAMSQPHAQCNFNEIILNLDDIQDRFIPMLRPVIRFEMWNIGLFKLKPIGDGVEEMSEKDVSGNGVSEWINFVSNGTPIEAMIKRMYVFGACVQFLSPERGGNGQLPVTGVWNDSELCATADWSVKVGNPGEPGTVLKKEVKIDLERIGYCTGEADGLFPDVDEGYAGWVWKGKMWTTVKEGRLQPTEGRIIFNQTAKQENDVVIVADSRD